MISTTDLLKLNIERRKRALPLLTREEAGDLDVAELLMLGMPTSAEAMPTPSSPEPPDDPSGE